MPGQHKASFILFSRWECIFEPFFYSNKHHNSEGNDLLAHHQKFTPVLKTTYKKLYLKYQDHARFPSLCLASKNAFLNYLLLKNGHNSVENHRIRLQFKLVLKIICKKLYLKCQDNASSLHCVWPLGMYFWVIFTKKITITQQEVTSSQKKLHLFWRLPIRSLS